MGSVITGRASGSRFRGYIEGGPELAAKLAQIEKSVRDELLVEATSAGAEVIAQEWRNLVQATFGLGPGTAHYVEAIGFRARPGKNGATAYVGLPNEVPQEPGEAHPREYAPRLEFTGKPTLRPAFDMTRQKALDLMADKIRELIGRVAPIERV